jgi:hypothetical protein
MEPDFGVDLPEIEAVIDTAEVFVVMFPTFEKRLLVDTRRGPNEGPLLRLVDRVRNAEERFTELRRLRPRFPAPERIIAFQWPRSVKTLVETGIWDRIETRLRSLGAIESTCKAVLAELQLEERQDAERAVRGEAPYQEALWPPKAGE